MTDTPKTTQPRTAWAIVAGEHSDVKVICPTRADAEAILTRAVAIDGSGSGSGYGGTRIEEYPIVTADTFQIVRHVEMQARFADDGTVTREDEWTTLIWPGDDQRQPLWWSYFPPHAPLWPALLRVAGTDIERVRKVYGERKAILQTDDAMRTQRAQSR